MIEFKCQQCGGMGRAWPSWIRKGGGKFCSPQCSTAAQSGPDKRVNGDGYVLLRRPGHPRALSGGWVYEHMVVVEAFLGRFLVSPEEIHHHNEIKSDNFISNLVLCTDKADHRRRHAENRIRNAGGDPVLHKICFRCRTLKPRSEFSPSVRHGQPSLNSACKPCAAELQRTRRLCARAV